MKDRSTASSSGHESDEAIQVEQELWENEMHAESEERIDGPEDEPATVDYELPEPLPPKRSPFYVSENVSAPESGSGPLLLHSSDARTMSSAAGSSTAPGTNEWLRARGANVEGTSSHKKQTFVEGRPEDAEQTSLSSDRSPPIRAPPAPTTPRAAISTQRSGLPHSTTTARSDQRLDQLHKGLPPNSIWSNRSIGFSTPQRPTEAELIQRGVYRTPARASTHDSQRSHPDPRSDPPATPLPHVNPQDPDIEYLSSVGLNIELERLAAHYGLNREIVERVYDIEGGLSATTSTLEEMVRAMEGVLARRGL